MNRKTLVLYSLFFLLTATAIGAYAGTIGVNDLFGFTNGYGFTDLNSTNVNAGTEFYRAGANYTQTIEIMIPNFDQDLNTTDTVTFVGTTVDWVNLNGDNRTAWPIPGGVSGNFSAQYIPFDYIVFTNVTDGKIYARSNDPTYDDGVGADFVNVVEAAFNNRSAVGAYIKFFGDYDIKSTLNFPNTTNLDFYLIGNGMQNSRLTAHADLGANTMMLCDRSAWGNPQQHTVIGIQDMYLDPNNIADACIELPFTMMDLDNLHIDMDLAGTNNIAIGRNGGSAGGTWPNRIGRIKFHFIGSSQPHKIMDLWYDTCYIEEIAVAIQMGDATQDLIVLNGEFYEWGILSLFHGESGSMDTVITASSVYLHIGMLTTISSGAGSTIDGILDLNSNSYASIDYLYVGDSGHTVFYDATSQTNSRIQGWGFNMKGSGSITSGGTTDVITHNCEYTPTADDITITLTENPTNTPGAIWVDTIGAATFTVNSENDPGASNLDFTWKVEK